MANSHVWPSVLAVGRHLARSVDQRLQFSSIWASPWSYLGFLKIWYLSFKSECSKRKEVETASLQSGYEIHLWRILSVRTQGQPRFKGRGINSTSQGSGMHTPAGPMEWHAGHLGRWPQLGSNDCLSQQVVTSCCFSFVEEMDLTFLEPPEDFPLWFVLHTEVIWIFTV